MIAAQGRAAVWGPNKIQNVVSRALSLSFHTQTIRQENEIEEKRLCRQRKSREELVLKLSSKSQRTSERARELWDPEWAAS